MCSSFAQAELLMQESSTISTLLASILLLFEDILENLENLSETPTI